jgi:hypothetical protein
MRVTSEGQIDNSWIDSPPARLNRKISTNSNEIPKKLGVSVTLASSVYPRFKEHAAVREHR